MGCLSDVEIQSVADGEGTAASADHIASCAACRRRLDERRRVLDAVAAVMESDGQVPPELDASLRRSMAAGGAVRGSTSLRMSPAPPWRRIGWVPALASVAGAALVVFLVLPKIGAPTTLSAAEILGRSLETLSSVHGVERLEYDLVFGGILNGPHRIVQLVDHDRPNRFLVENYGPDGVLASAFSQDPATRQRSQLVRVDGRNYIIRLTAVPDSILSLPQMIHAQIEAMLTMMQGSADQRVTVADTAAGRRYVITIPPTAPAQGPVPMELYQARAVVDASTFLIEEFEANGTLLKQPFTISFKLARRVLQPAGASSDAFTIGASGDDVVLQGESSVDPMSDALATALRELARAKR